ALTTHVTVPPGRGTLRNEGDDLVLHVEEMLSTRVSLDFHFYGAQQLTPCLEVAGFEVLQYQERDPYGPGVEAQTRRAYLLARKLG
ncbi:MAG TPA: hypothetical protein VGR90_05190, partial [Acidimicrobiales bacterium]|nr:hypothetical protein [Acidimicrobiales bacterium]